MFKIRTVNMQKNEMVRILYQGKPVALVAISDDGERAQIGMVGEELGHDWDPATRDYLLSQVERGRA